MEWIRLGYPNDTQVIFWYMVNIGLLHLKVQGFSLWQIFLIVFFKSLISTRRGSPLISLIFVFLFCHLYLWTFATRHHQVLSLLFIMPKGGLLWIVSYNKHKHSWFPRGELLWVSNYNKHKHSWCPKGETMSSKLQQM